MKIAKRFLALWLAIIMVVGMIPQNVLAAEGEEAVSPVTEEVQEAVAGGEVETETPVETKVSAKEEQESQEELVAEETEVQQEETGGEEKTVVQEMSAVSEPEDSVNAQAVEGTSLDTSNLKFDVEKPAGYVTVSFVDNGVRPENAGIENAELYGTAVGTIIKETEVPYETGDSVADVTVRLLEAMELEYDSTGSVDDGFYLAALKNFQFNGNYYATFGEFDAGSQSGWCVRVNNWHINQGTSAVEVEDEDVISWLYTCQYGADIGADFSTKSAEITGIDFTSEYGTLSPEFTAKTEEYSYVVDENTSEIAFEVKLENYGAVTTVTVDGNVVKYRPNKAIAVTPSSKIMISTKLEYMDAADNNKVTTYTDSIAIQLKPYSEPKVADDAPKQLNAVAGEKISVDLSTFFVGGDELTYNVKIDKLNLNRDVEGSTFTGTIPTAGTYEVVITASDGKASASHTVTVTVTEAAANTAPNIKAAYAETNSNTYIYSNTYVYIYMDDIFEDADGDVLTYEATLDGEKVDVSYNSWSKEYYIQFATKPAVREYKIKAYDGKAYSEEFTAKCIGTSATITAPEGSSLMSGGNYLYYVKGTAENDTFKLDYTLDVNEKLDTEWMASNTNVLTSNGDGTFTVADSVTSRQQVYAGVTCGKDGFGSVLYLGTKYIYILPAMPEVDDIEAELAEHADNQTATVVSNAFTGWYSSEFNYEMSDPAIAEITTSGSYGLSVTPKALGTTTVTATFKYDESIKCTFDVTVTGRSLQIKDQPGVDSVIYEEGKTVQMEVLGAEESDIYRWTSSNESVATVNQEGLVTVHKLGTAYITATALNEEDTTPNKASMYLQVKEAGKVYLEDIALTQYSYFGEISAKSAFNSAQLEYDWDLQENRYTYSTLQFTPYFDGENLNAVLHYQVSGGEYQTMDLTDAKAVSISNGLNPGENVVKIDVYPKDDEDNITIYTFNIFRPYNPSNTITRMTVYPNGETALAYPTYLDNKEGTIFQWDVENNNYKTGWNGKPATGWSSTVYSYKTFLYGDRTDTVSFYPTFAYANQRVQIWVDGEYVEEAVTNWKSSTIKINEDITEVVFKVVSEKYYAEKTAEGKDPFENPEKIYTVFVENVKPLGIDAKILSAELEGGEFYKPGFTSDSYTISGLIPSGETTADLTFTVPAGIDVYKTSVSDANKLVLAKQDEEGNNVYTTPIVTITGTGMYAYSTTNIILQVTDEEGNIGKAQYAFTVSQRGAKDIYPDEVIEYLCIGSQYTNAGNYGTMPERTLKSGGGTLSLGNFGGYITYKYDRPIENNPNNPYGVDFVIYGNSFGNGGHEPGYVQVSKDGKTWYTLAGSDHFDDHNDWGFSMTYKNNNGKSAWSNSDGESGEIYNYPSADLYPYFTWTESLEQSITVSGSRLNSSAKDAYGSSAAVLPEFGYVDVNTNGTINGTANNPYNHPNAITSGGDQFDLSWAVDDNGMPVEIDSISYIRVATASSIYAGAIGEKSTEVSAVNRVTNVAEEAVGKTSAPTSITINDVKVTGFEESNVCTFIYDEEDVAANGFNVSVEASEESNVYINGNGVSSYAYTAIPEKGIIRIIVQEGEKEPYICYIKLTDEILEPEEPENPDEPQKPEVDPEVEEIYKTTGNYLKNLADQYPPTVNSTGGEWTIIGLTRSGQDVPDGYYSNVVDYVSKEINDKEQLHRSKSTDNARVILALTAAGYDVTDVDGHNLLQGLTDMKYVKKQGINGSIWALIAFDSHNYEIPTATDGADQVTREKLIDTILNAQLADGGWALDGSVADVDMTGMALQALAPYYDTNSEVKAAVDVALTTLSKMQLADGGFVSEGDKNAESCAQVIVALTALGIDPLEDSRFIKDGNSVIDALCSYYVEGGGFKHLADGKRDGMATEQGYYALVSYFRLKNNQTRLYDMSDVKITGATEDDKKEEDDKQTDDKENDQVTQQQKDDSKVKAEGSTKVIGDGDNKVVIDGVTYMVDKEAADLMTTIDKLSKQEEPDAQEIIDAYKVYAAMSKSLKAQVFNYDDLESMTNELGIENHKDEATGMEVTGLEWYIKLVVEEVAAGNEYDTVASNIGSNELVKLWNIRLFNVLTEEEVQPEEAITIKVEAPDMSGYVETIIVHNKDNGKMDYLECELMDGFLSFTIESTGLFGVAGNSGESTLALSEAGTVTTDGAEVETAIIWPWLLLAALGVAALIIIIAKKKKEENE